MTQSGTPHILAEKKKVKLKIPLSSTSAAPAASRQEASVSASSQSAASGSSSVPAAPKADATAVKMARAQKLFQKNQLNEAYDLFEEVAASGSSTYSVTARYMMGQCLFNQKEYDKAIMQYQKIISQHPGDEKAPTAMFRQGVAFEQLSDKETARVIYKKIIKQHGSSPEAEKAKEKLSKL